MKKRLCVLLAAAMILSLAACGNKGVLPDNSGKSSASSTSSVKGGSSSHKQDFTDGSSAAGGSSLESASGGINNLLSKDLYEVPGGTISNIEFVSQESDMSNILSSTKDRNAVFQAMKEQLENQGYEVSIEDDGLYAESGDYEVSLAMDNDSTIVTYKYWGYDPIDIDKAAAEISYFVGIPVSAKEIASYFEYVEEHHGENGSHYLSGTNADDSIYFHIASTESAQSTYSLSMEREF